MERIVVPDSDKMQFHEDKTKRKDVGVEPLADQLSSRSLVTNAPLQ